MSTRGWEQVTQQDVNRRQLKAAPKPSKYRNVRYETGGEKFDSKHEADVWLGLKTREAAGEIRFLTRQHKFPLYCPYLRITPAKPELRTQVSEYIADFTFLDGPIEAGTLHVIDAKSKATRTAVYKLKKKWLELQDGIIIEEI